MSREVQVVEETPKSPTKGSAGLRSQFPGMATTVGNVASATGGIGRGKFIETDKK